MFGCIDSKIVGGKDEKVIILTKRDGNNIIFSINPNIPIKEFPKNSAGKREGTARVYLQANNIKKYIKVHYDVTPYSKVSPKNVLIDCGKAPDDKQVLEKHFVVEPNLCGLKSYHNINGTPTEKASGSRILFDLCFGHFLSDTQDNVLVIFLCYADNIFTCSTNNLCVNAATVYNSCA